MSDRKVLMFAFESTNITSPVFSESPAIALAANAAGALYVAPVILSNSGVSVKALNAADAEQLATFDSAEALLTNNPGNWAVFHQPAVSVRATITRAAGAAGFRHVCTGFSFSLNAVGAITVPVVVNLRDGATGAGTILWTERFTAPVGTTFARNLTGLNIVGSEATAMTFEFAVAPTAGDFQSVNLQGYTTS